MASSQACLRRALLQNCRAQSRSTTRANRWHTQQQTRNLSLWGSGSSKSSETPLATSNAPSQASSTTSDIVNSSNTSRPIQASPDISADVSYQSTTPTSLEPQFIENIQQAVADPSGVAHDVPTGLAALPERLGYLKYDCGLDFGWGTSTIMQFLYENLHITAGLSWTASAVVLGLAIRSLQLPALIGSAGQATKMKEFQQSTAVMREAYTAAAANKNQVEMQRLAAQIKLAKERSGIRFSKMFAPMLLQIPLGFGAWRTLRNAADLPVPGFVTESWLWTHDLCFGDPYYIVPAVSSFMTYLTLKTQSASQSGSGVAGAENMQKIMRNTLPGITFLFTSFQPGAVQLYFASSAFVGFVCAKLMSLTAFRALFNLPPVEQKAKPTNPTTSPTKTAVGSSTTVDLRRAEVGGMRIPQREARLVRAEQDRIANERRKAEEWAQRSKIDQGVDTLKKFRSGLGDSMRKAALEMQNKSVDTGKSKK